jgi:hypothetical protein
VTHDDSKPTDDDTSTANDATTVADASPPADTASASPNAEPPRAGEVPENEPDGADDPRSRKERVLHTRVPGVLEDELKRLATSLRVPVSNVVRAILEDAVEAADRVSRRTEGGIRGWSDRIAEERVRLRERVVPPRPAPASSEPSPQRAPASQPTHATHAESIAPVAPLAGVLGFQQIYLATAASCVLCGRALAAGDEAFLGIRETHGPRVLVGRECLPGRAAPASHEP